MSIRLQVPGTDFMRRAVREAERASERAQKRTMRKTAQWAGRESARGLARSNRIPLRALQRRPWERRAGRAGRMRWTIDDEAANVWIGTLAVKAAYIGKLSQNSRSARAGRHTFPGAFIATMPATASGGQHTGVFRRANETTRWTAGRPHTSSANLPIIEQRVHLEGAQAVEADVGSRLFPRYREILRQETNFENQKWAARFGR